MQDNQFLLELESDERTQRLQDILIHGVANALVEIQAAPIAFSTSAATKTFTTCPGSRTAGLDTVDLRRANCGVSSFNHDSSQDIED